MKNKEKIINHNRFKAYGGKVMKRMLVFLTMMLVCIVPFVFAESIDWSGNTAEQVDVFIDERGLWIVNDFKPLGEQPTYDLGSFARRTTEDCMVTWRDYNGDGSIDYLLLGYPYDHTVKGWVCQPYLRSRGGVRS